MATWEREAVHADGDHRPVRVDLLERERLVVAVSGLDVQPGGLGACPDEVEELLQRDAGPAGVADQRAADGVGDAGERDDPLAGGQRTEVVEPERAGPIDEPVDPQPPALRVERGVL